MDELGKARRRDQQKHEQLGKQLKRATEERNKLQQLLSEQAEARSQKPVQSEESAEIEKLQSQLRMAREVQEELRKERESKQALQKVNADLHFELQKLQRQLEQGKRTQAPQISLEALIDYEPDFDSLRSPASSQHGDRPETSKDRRLTIADPGRHYSTSGGGAGATKKNSAQRQRFVSMLMASPDDQLKVS